jgi:putative transposase
LRDRITHAGRAHPFASIAWLICGGHRAVALENVALRQQLAVFRRTVRRPTLRTKDRLFWVLFAKAWPQWRTALILVQPDTVVRWHRPWLRRRWTRRSMPARPGRPSTAETIRTLVAKMGAANPLWGAPRIHGELVKLGIAVSERTVSRLLRRRRRPPSQTWRTFLTNHVTSLVSMDSSPCRHTGRGLFVLVLLSHHRRQIVHLAILNIQPQDGRPNRSLTLFRTIPHRVGSSEIAMLSMATRSGAASLA